MVYSEDEKAFLIRVDFIKSVLKEFYGEEVTKEKLNLKVEEFKNDIHYKAFESLLTRAANCLKQLGITIDLYTFWILNDCGYKTADIETSLFIKVPENLIDVENVKKELKDEDEIERIYTLTGRAIKRL